MTDGPRRRRSPRPRLRPSTHAEPAGATTPAPSKPPVAPKPGSPPVTAPTHAGQAPTDRPVHGADSALASWAHFTLEIGASRAIGRNGIYDDRTHRYDPSYIKPTSYTLRVNARLGLTLNLKNTSRIPSELVAYSWAINAEASGFHAAEIVQRPIKPMEVAIFELPARSDSYEVRLRVSFADGRFGERTIHFDVRDWLIVSLGDSSASGQGNPDQVGSLGLTGGTVCDHPTLALAVGTTPNVNNDAQWLERRAYRSLKSVPAVAALSLEVASGSTFHPPGPDLDRFSFDRITFASFARSGAEVVAGLIDPQEGERDFIGVGQFEECRRTVMGRPIDVLMIDIGGNDAGFSIVLEELVSRDSIYASL